VASFSLAVPDLTSTIAPSGLLTTTQAREETDINAYTFKRFGGMRLTYVVEREGTMSLIQYRHDSSLADEVIDLQDFEL